MYIYAMHAVVCETIITMRKRDLCLLVDILGLVALMLADRALFQQFPDNVLHG